MGALRLGLLLLALGGLQPARAECLGRWEGAIAEASTRFGIPAPWIRQVIKMESGGRAMIRGRPLVSRAGAIGLMQLMPGTWSDMRTLLGLGDSVFDPRDNILAGTAYLRLMYERFGYPGLFAAYNAGPERYADFLAGRRNLPAETHAYVRLAAAATTALATAPARRAHALHVQPPGVLFALAPVRKSDARRIDPRIARDPGGLFATLEGIRAP